MPGRVTPYVGAGVGIARLRLNDGVFVDESFGTTTLQAMAGISVAVHHRLYVFVDVRAQRLVAGQITSTVASQTSHVGLTNRALVTGLRAPF